MASEKKLPVFKTGVEYGSKYMLPMDSEMKKAINEHEMHHAPEEPYLDGQTLPYSRQDRVHSGRR